MNTTNLGIEAIKADDAVKAAEKSVARARKMLENAEKRLEKARAKADRLARQFKTATEIDKLG